MTKASQPKRSNHFGTYRWHLAWTVDVAKREVHHNSGLVYDFSSGYQCNFQPPLGGRCPCSCWHGQLRGGLSSLPDGYSEQAAVRLWLEASTLFSDESILACQDCSKITIGDDYYMIQHDLWRQVHPNYVGMLCLTCLQTRLGRSLVKSDFIHAPVNDMNRRVAALRQSPLGLMDTNDH